MASFPFVMSERWAVSTLFLVNGFAIGSWAVHIPEFVERLAISEGTLGLLIAVFGLGSLIAMPLAGATIAKIGDAPVTKVLSLIATTSLLLVGLAPNIWLSGAALFLFGALIASMDVAMNATAVEVEKSIRTPIMSSCHGFWSLGGLLSAFLGGFVIQAAGGWVQILVVTGLAIVLVVISVPNIAGHAVRRQEKGRQTQR